MAVRRQHWPRGLQGNGPPRGAGSRRSAAMPSAVAPRPVACGPLACNGPPAGKGLQGLGPRGGRGPLQTTRKQQAAERQAAGGGRQLPGRRRKRGTADADGALEHVQEDEGAERCREEQRQAEEVRDGEMGELVARAIIGDSRDGATNCMISHNMGEQAVWCACAYGVLRSIVSWCGSASPSSTRTWPGSCGGRGAGCP